MKKNIKITFMVTELQSAQISELSSKYSINTTEVLRIMIIYGFKNISELESLILLSQNL